MLCSKARRARQTWQYVAVGLAGTPEVITDTRLYEADAGDLLSIFAETDPQVSRLMYVGHNPAAAEVTEILVAAPVDFPMFRDRGHRPDGGMADIAGGDGQLAASWTPQAQA